MKMFEKILERRLRKVITVNNMQFRFSSGKGTTDMQYLSYNNCKKKPRSAQGFVLYLPRKSI